MKGEFYKMEYDAWDEGTVELTLEEEAAYLRLCHQMYRRKGPVPVTDRMLCALWRCHQNKARPLLQRLIDKGKITLLPDGLATNKRATQEIDDRETLRTHRVHAGHTGGIRSADARRKSLKSNDTVQAKSSREEKIREEKKESSAVEPTRTTYSQDFETKFWLPYPRTQTMSKKDAWRAWQRLTPAKREDACKALEPYKRSMRGKEQYIVHACRFLSQERFEGFLANGTTLAPVFDIRAHLA